MDSEEGHFDRRSMIRKMAGAGVVAWTAPLVLESLTSVAAAGSSVPAYVGKGTTVQWSDGAGGDASSGTKTVPLPAGVQAGDLLVWIFVHNKDNTTLGPPTGYVTTNFVTDPKQGSHLSLTVVWKIAGAAEPPPTFNGGNASEGSSARIIAFRNVDQTAPWDPASATLTSATTSTYTSAGQTTTDTNVLAIAIVAQTFSNKTAPNLTFQASQGFSVLSGFQDQVNSAAQRFHTVSVATKLFPSAGSVTYPTWQSQSAGSNNWVGVGAGIDSA